jgi:hypothetical protein
MYGIIIYKYYVLDLRVLARVNILDTTRKLVRLGIPSVYSKTLLKRVLLILKEELNESLNTPIR